MARAPWETFPAPVRPITMGSSGVVDPERILSPIARRAALYSSKLEKVYGRGKCYSVNDVPGWRL